MMGWLENDVIAVLSDPYWGGTWRQEAMCIGELMNCAVLVKYIEILVLDCMG